jgi:NADH dehydrogenase
MGSSRPQVLIIGGGFGGLWATRALRREPVDITLIDRTNHHLFQPLLYQVATAALSPADIAAPLRHILRRQKNVRVLHAQARAIDLARSLVDIGGEQLSFDYLIVATGANHAYFGNPQWAQHAPGLKSLDDALAMRAHMLQAFERAEREPDPEQRAAWLRFAVIGGGPTGVELAGSLAEIARHTLPEEFRQANPKLAEIHLIEAGPRLLASFSEAQSRSAQQQLERLGAQVHLNCAVSDLQAGLVRCGERQFRCQTIWWAAGVAASSLARDLAATQDRAGRVLVAPDLSLQEHQNVFVVGDLASVKTDGTQVPGVAPAAKQMGTHAARMIAGSLQGKPRQAFRYRDFGNFATIGRMAAVLEKGPIKLRGMLAWWVWLFAHVLFLIGFRNRIAVLLNWAVSYFTYQRHARILGASSLKGKSEGSSSS